MKGSMKMIVPNYLAGEEKKRGEVDKIKKTLMSMKMIVPNSYARGEKNKRWGKGWG